MIPANAITAWGVDRPWPTREQVEQDLLLSRAICAIAADGYLGTELVFRGGTALHKLHLDRAYRYSEDLDYVRSSAGGIAPLTQTLTRLGTDLGFEVRTRVGKHPKVYWRTTAESGVPRRWSPRFNLLNLSPRRSARSTSGPRVATCSTSGLPLITSSSTQPTFSLRSPPTAPPGSLPPERRRTSPGSSRTLPSGTTSTRS